jgi:aminoglycoside phosphotransferase (APT) family kinase protein
LAYASGLLPQGPGLSAPACYGVVDGRVYLEDVVGGPERPEVAAARLAAWQAATAVFDRPWRAGNQLAQRLAVTELSWDGVDVDHRLAVIWQRRRELLSIVESLPVVISHGDFHAGNLIADGERTVALDWAAFGAAPVGADLAHLALSVADDVSVAYLSGLDGRFDPAAVLLGYRVTLALTGVSRIHWMVSNGVPVPAGYQEFVLDQVAALA